ncbi:MAG: hypothetical protein M0R17_00680 [Candidatus Omnitrophica bacterium]|jgi:hypothetical protein|nr:hypothetical protein [Candidatus Omnitrophota bacterium]
MSDITGYGIKLNKEYRPYSKLSFNEFNKSNSSLSKKDIEESYEKTIHKVIKYIIAIGAEELQSQLKKYSEYDPIVINRESISEKEYAESGSMMGFEVRLYADTEILDKMVEAAKKIKQDENIYTEPINGKIKESKFKDTLDTIIKVSARRNNNA